MPMAASTTFKHLPFFFLLLLLFSSVQIDARVNKFFSKFIHTDHDNVVLPVANSPTPVSAPPEISPSLPPTLAPAPFFDESQNAYGLYGRDSDDDEGSRTITDVEEEILAEDGEESYKSGYPKTKLQSENYVSPNRNEQFQYPSNYDNNNNGYRSNSEYENNEYRNSEYESDFENNGGRNYPYQSNFQENDYRKSRYESTERQGMSDTRFMENGRYYHDVNSSPRNGGDQDESYGSKKYPKYEFDSMEEYEKSEGILP